jgi:hypothetical protein
VCQHTQECEVSEFVTAAVTVIVGTAVFVSGQVIQRWLIEPIQGQRRIIGQVAFALLMFANVAAVDEVKAHGWSVRWSKDPEEVTRELRSLAARLQESLYAIPAYGAFAWLRVVPSRQRILEAMKALVQWSNSVHSGQPATAQDSVATALQLVRNP